MQEAALSFKAKQWRIRVFAATWLAYFGYYFARKPFYVAKPLLEEELGWDPDMLAILGAAYLVSYTIGQFVSAWAGDRWGPRVLVLTGMAVTIVANALFGFVNSWGMFCALMIVNGLAQASGWCGNVGSMARWFRRSERGSVMGVWATNFQIGGVLATTLAAFLLDLQWTIPIGDGIVVGGLRWSFFGGSLVLLCIWAFFVFNQRNRPEDVGLPPIVADEEGEFAVPQPGDPARPVRARWSREIWNNVLLLGSFYFFVKFIRYAIWSWAPYLLWRFYQLTPSEAGYASVAFDAAGAAGVVALGVMSDRLFGGRRVRLSAWFIAAMCVSCLLLFLVGQTSIAVFVVCLALIGFSLYGPDAILTSAGAIDAGTPASAAKAAGIINGMGAIGSVVQEFVMARLLSVATVSDTLVKAAARDESVLRLLFAGEPSAAAADSGVGAAFGALLLASVAAWLALMVIQRRNRRGQADL